MKNNNSTRFIILTTILLIISLSSVFSVVNMWNNTLLKNNDWSSSKTELRKGVVGAYAYMTTHYALIGGKLNLSAYYGYQELYYKKLVDTKNLKLDFKLTPNSYFNILIANKQDTISEYVSQIIPNTPIYIFWYTEENLLKRLLFLNLC